MLQTHVGDANGRAKASNRRAGELRTKVNDANRTVKVPTEELECCRHK